MTPHYKKEIIRFMVEHKIAFIAFALYIAYVEPWPLTAFWIINALIIKALW